MPIGQVGFLDMCAQNGNCRVRVGTGSLTSKQPFSHKIAKFLDRGWSSRPFPAENKSGPAGVAAVLSGLKLSNLLTMSLM